MSRKLPKNIARLKDEKDLTYLKNVEKRVISIDENYPKPYIVLKYYQPSHQCFSEWNGDDLKAFSKLIQKMREVGWSELIRKGALGFKIHKYNERLPEKDRKCLSNILSPDITFSELRVTEKARIHGFKILAAFYLVWLDKNHEIFPMS